MFNAKLTYLKIFHATLDFDLAEGYNRAVESQYKQYTQQYNHNTQQFNIQQDHNANMIPITGPYMFVMMALGVTRREYLY